MITLLIFVIIGVVIGFRSTRGDEFFLRIMFSFVGALGFLVFGALFLVVSSEFVPDSAKTIVGKHEYYIYNLQDNSQTSGNFSLGCGRVQEKMVYTFYIKGSNGYIPVNLNVSQCAIVETDKTPEVIIRTYEFKNKNLDNWFYADGPDPKYIINVPKGTIVRNYNLDAKY